MMDDPAGTPGERRAQLVAWLRESGADPIDIMDAQSGVPTVAEWREYIYGRPGGWSLTI